jgi:hypothetical protein
MFQNISFEEVDDLLLNMFAGGLTNACKANRRNRSRSKSVLIVIEVWDLPTRLITLN